MDEIKCLRKKINDLECDNFFLRLEVYALKENGYITLLNDQLKNYKTLLNNYEELKSLYQDIEIIFLETDKLIEEIKKIDKELLELKIK